MDIMETWETINARVDWFLTGIVTLLIANLLLPAYVGWSYMNQQPFNDKYNLQDSDIFVQKAQQLENLPTMDDIEIEPHEGQQPLPDRYLALQTTDMFIPAGGQDLGPLVEEESGTDPETGEPREETLPEISGYQIIGRITGRGTMKASVIQKLASGDEESMGTGERPTFIAREGEYLENSDVKVEAISDTSVRLSQPGHRDTTFQFEIDKMSEKIRQSVTVQ